MNADAVAQLEQYGQPEEILETIKALWALFPDYEGEDSLQDLVAHRFGQLDRYKANCLCRKSNREKMAQLETDLLAARERIAECERARLTQQYEAAHAQFGPLDVGPELFVKMADLDAGSAMAFRCAAVMCPLCAQGQEPKWMIVFQGWTHVWMQGNGHTKCGAGPIWEKVIGKGTA